MERGLTRSWCTPVRCIVPVVTAPERSSLDSLAAEGRVDAEPLPDAERLFFAKATYDVGTGRYAASFPGDGHLPATDDVLAVVAFWSFPEEGFLQALSALGIEPLEPAPYMGYLVVGSRAALQRASVERPEVRTVLPLPLGLKRFGFEQESDPSPAHEASTTVTLVRAREGAVLALLAAREGRRMARGVAAAPTASYTVTLTRSEAELLATYPEVISVRRNVVPATPSDERFNRIVSGGFQSLDAPWPAGPWPLSIGSDPVPSMPANTAPYYWDGYLSQLSALGGGTFDPANQTIGFVDSGIDSGLRRQGADYCPPYLRPPGYPTAPCRLVFTADETSWHQDVEVRGDDPDYHGTMVTSIAAGLAGDTSGGRDSQGFALTQGTAAGAKVAVCRFFRSCVDQSVTWRRFPGGEEDLGDQTLDPRIRYAIVEMSATGALPDNETGPGARLFNHSWNLNYDAGYEQISRTLDIATRRVNAVAFAFGSEYGGQTVTGGSGSPRQTLHVVSAGNVEPGSDIVTAPAVAKNVLTVGASEGLNQENYTPGIPTQDPHCGTRTWAIFADRPAERSGLSRIGWPNLRAKPDLLAPGMRAYGRRSIEGASSCSQAPCYKDQIPVSGDYAWSSGTSFAAPVVTGAAALVSEWPRTTGRTDPSPALLKAILIGSSRNLRSCNTGCPCGSSDDVRPAPDKYQGWGGVDLSRLFRPASNYYFHDQGTTLTPQSQPWTKDLVITDPTKDVVVTLVWTDRHSLDTYSWVNNLVNDLDLIVGTATAAGAPGPGYFGNRFYDVFDTCSPPYRDGYSWSNQAWSSKEFDRKNNVEKVYIKASDLAAAGTTRAYVTVRPFSITADGMDPDTNPPWMLFRQDFALYVENAHE